MGDENIIFPETNSAKHYPNLKRCGCCRYG